MGIGRGTSLAREGSEKGCEVDKCRVLDSRTEREPENKVAAPST